MCICAKFVKNTPSDNTPEWKRLIAILYILDKEKPILDNCPTDQTQTTEPGKPVRMVQWSQPVATDNSGVIQTVSCDVKSGTDFAIGQTKVTCTVIDGYGNNNKCTFHIDVIGKLDEAS